MYPALNGQSTYLESIDRAKERKSYKDDKAEDERNSREKERSKECPHILLHLLKGSYPVLISPTFPELQASLKPSVPKGIHHHYILLKRI